MKRRVAWIVLAVAVLVTAAWEYIPLTDASARLAGFELRGLAYAARDLPLTESEQTSFGKAGVVKRLVRTRDGRFVVTVLDGTRDRHAVHDPMYCFAGAGWKVEARREVRVPGGTAQAVTLVRGDERTEAIYWFSNGEDRWVSAPRYWWSTSVRRLTRGWSGGEPVLVLMQGAPGAHVDWLRVLKAVPALLTL